MKRIAWLGGMLAQFWACSPVDQNMETASCQETTVLNAHYAKAGAVQQLLDRYTREGVPGVAVALYTPQEGYWAAASGYANLEHRTPMQVCHLQYSQSIAKTYTATALLKLAEKGQLRLDAPISQYLPTTVRARIADADRITVRMLLNHTSGLPNYSLDIDYVSFLLQHPLRPFTSDEYLAYISGEPLLFEPGSYFSYSDTNYLLLALIADGIHGDHARLIRESVFVPLGLQQTFYHDSPAYLAQPNLVDSYFDRFGNGELENVTQMQRTNVGCLKGDDGLIASPTDYIKFLRGLFEGRLGSPESLTEMTTWVKDKAGSPAYGMGLYTQVHGQYRGYGHGGAGIGAGATLYYFPDKQLYLFIGTNLGTLTDGPAVRKADQLKEEMLDLLLN